MSNPAFLPGIKRIMSFPVVQENILAKSDDFDATLSESEFKSSEMRNKIDVLGTTALATFRLLKHMSNGADEKWFTHHADNTAPEDPFQTTALGYLIDDWLRAFTCVRAFIKRRKGSYNLLTSRGFRKTESKQPLRKLATERNGILPEALSSVFRRNVSARQRIAQLRDQIQSLPDTFVDPLFIATLKKDLDEDAAERRSGASQSGGKRVLAASRRADQFISNLALAYPSSALAKTLETFNDDDRVHIDMETLLEFANLCDDLSNPVTASASGEAATNPVLDCLSGSLASGSVYGEVSDTAQAVTEATNGAIEDPSNTSQFQDIAERLANVNRLINETESNYVGVEEAASVTGVTFAED